MGNSRRRSEKEKCLLRIQDTLEKGLESTAMALRYLQQDKDAVDEEYKVELFRELATICSKVGLLSGCRPGHF
jgi:hypothetical protein